ncbi:hypothetical protein C8Q79DRAFT_125239 [Trametes meyenii]|nr:hypothetical protein C8Q79DRAFT_125239 [Trametes meyenii]
MLSLFAARVLPRAHASTASQAAFLAVHNAREHVVARTFLTTASASAPASKTNESESEEKPKRTRRTAAEVKASKDARAREVAAEEKARLRAAKQKEKEKAKQQALKEREKAKQQALKEKARLAKEKEKAKKEAQAEKEKQLLEDPEARFKLPLKKVNVKKDELPPKQPRGAYNIFIKESFEKLMKEPSTFPSNEVFLKSANAFSQRWKTLSDEERQVYLDMEKQEKEAYRKAAKEWYNNTDPRIIRALVAQKHRLPLKPAEFKRPHSPYMMFTREQWHKVEVPAGLSASEAMIYRGKQIAALWRQVPEEEKRRLSEEYAKQFQEYRQRMAAQQAGHKA